MSRTNRLYVEQLSNTFLSLFQFDQHVLKCAKCGENIIFEDNSLGLESLPVKCGKLDGAMFRKTNGILCSLCSSSRRFAFLNSEQNIGNIEKKLKNREFLRYFIGALPDKVPFIYSIITFRV